MLGFNIKPICRVSGDIQLNNKTQNLYLVTAEALQRNQSASTKQNINSELLTFMNNCKI